MERKILKIIMTSLSVYRAGFVSPASGLNLSQNSFVTGEQASIPLSLRPRLHHTYPDIFESATQFLSGLKKLPRSHVAYLVVVWRGVDLSSLY